MRLIITKKANGDPVAIAHTDLGSINVWSDGVERECYVSQWQIGDKTMISTVDKAHASRDHGVAYHRLSADMDFLEMQGVDVEDVKHRLLHWD